MGCMAAVIRGGLRTGLTGRRWFGRDPRFAFSDVEVAEYPTPASNGKMSSVQLAEVLWANLQKDHVWEHREVVFLAHSLGGILVEEMLLRHPADACEGAIYRLVWDAA